MTTFLRLLAVKDKACKLLANCNAVRLGTDDASVFEVKPDSFRAVAGAPFAYWVSETLRQVFQQFLRLENSNRTARQGLATAEDFRFLRTWWETNGNKWFPFAKGGSYSAYFSSIDLVVNWAHDGAEIKAGICKRYPYLNGNAEFVAKNPQFYTRPGLSYPPTALGYDRKGLGMYVLPKGCIFGHKACSIFVKDDAPDELMALLSILSSQAVDSLFRVLAQSRSWEVGHLQDIPVPVLSETQSFKLSQLSRKAWLISRRLKSVSETSYGFVLPAVLCDRLDGYHLPTIEIELARIQAEINDISFELYGLSEFDRPVVTQSLATDSESSELGEADDDEGNEAEVPSIDGLLSWAVGVVFGRFDWRLATGERKAPSDPDPFDALPTKSPGMLPKDTEPFHAHNGILVDSQAHPHDLARLVEEVLTRINAAVPDDVRHWLQRDFFAFHLQCYSKSRRKAPIYWPLSTASCSYTIWVYYPSLNNQTLFTAVNDFLDGPNGKLTQASRDCAELRNKGGGRSRDEEKQYEMLQTFEQELTDLRNILLKIAPIYQPNHDDGVQINAAPLWLLFRHMPWQRVLKDTWTKLEKGDYDWAHLAMAYWPSRVREKCKTDKSLAIAHGVEELYVEPEAAPKKTRGKKKAGDNE